MLQKPVQVTTYRNTKHRERIFHFLILFRLFLGLIILLNGRIMIEMSRRNPG